LSSFLEQRALVATEGGGVTSSKAVLIYLSSKQSSFAAMGKGGDCQGQTQLLCPPSVQMSV